uniref:Uncharacterized protein n=1 Tax=Knipowitschia caucasica TaxID=637954 RepID=A0AAV2KBR2_KNICA
MKVLVDPAGTGPQWSGVWSLSGSLWHFPRDKDLILGGKCLYRTTCWVSFVPGITARSGSFFTNPSSLHQLWPSGDKRRRTTDAKCARALVAAEILFYPTLECLTRGPLPPLKTETASGNDFCQETNFTFCSCFCLCANDNECTSYVRVSSCGGRLLFPRMSSRVNSPPSHSYLNHSSPHILPSTNPPSPTPSPPIPSPPPLLPSPILPSHQSSPPFHNSLQLIPNLTP